jgi:hypothetical protein
MKKKPDKSLPHQCLNKSVRGSYEPQNPEKEREKAGEKGRKKSRKKQKIVLIKNKVVVKKVEKKIGKMGDSCRTLL